MRSPVLTSAIVVPGSRNALVQRPGHAVAKAERYHPTPLLYRVRYGPRLGCYGPICAVWYWHYEPYTVAMRCLVLTLALLLPSAYA